MFREKKVTPFPGCGRDATTSSSTPHIEARRAAFLALPVIDLPTCGLIYGQTAPQVDNGIIVMVFFFVVVIDVALFLTPGHLT